MVFSSCTDLVQREQGTIIAEVGSEVLTLEEVQQIIPPQVLKSDSARTVEKFRNNWVKKQLLAKEARRMGLHNDDHVRQNLKRAEKEVLSQAVITQLLSEVEQEPVSRQDAQSYYENYKDQFVLNERHVRYRHVVTETLQESRNAKAALQRGIPWERVAEEYTISPSDALRNANMFYPISLAAIEYDLMHSYLQRIGITEISPIHRIGETFHFVQLMEDRDKGDHPEVDWVLDQIEEWLRLDRKQRRINSFERNLLLQAESNNEIRFHDVESSIEPN